MTFHMSKNRRHRNRKKSQKSVDPGIMASYYGDPIALLKDGNYELLDALYNPDDSPPNEPLRPTLCSVDDIPF